MAGEGLKFKEDPDKSKEGEKRITKDVPTKVTVGILGGDPQELSLKPGTTYGEVVKQLNWPANAEIRVNDSDVDTKAVIKEGDVIVAFPAAITGGGQKSKKRKAKVAKVKAKARKPKPKVSKSVERRVAIQKASKPGPLIGGPAMTAVPPQTTDLVAPAQETLSTNLI